MEEWKEVKERRKEDVKEEKEIIELIGTVQIGFARISIISARSDS